jgi:hypothetical protein
MQDRDKNYILNLFVHPMTKIVKLVLFRGLSPAPGSMIPYRYPMQ